MLPISIKDTKTLGFKDSLERKKGTKTQHRSVGWALDSNPSSALISSVIFLGDSTAWASVSFLAQ